MTPSKHPSLPRLLVAFFLSAALLATPALAQSAAGPEIRTPKPPATPRINGPAIFGVRPGHPFFYQIPATGERPMEFSVDRLPGGLNVDAKTGLITGSMPERGDFDARASILNCIFQIGFTTIKRETPRPFFLFPIVNVHS